jgi:hypothetical protein
MRLLWRRRILAAVGVVVAVGVGFSAGKTVPAHGIASTRVLIDTPQSALAVNSAQGMDTLYWRATLLAMLLGSGSGRQRLARTMHVAQSQIAVTDLELTAPTVPASLPVAAIKAATSVAQPYVLTLHTDDVLPIVDVDATAPDGPAAVRLARAAVRVLQAGASANDTATVQGLDVRQAAPVVVHQTAGGAGHTKMAIVAVIVFALWCMGVIVGPACRRRPAPRQANLSW